MGKSSKQMKVVFQWLGAPDIALFKLVQEAANSMSEPTSLVLSARRTLCIVHAVQEANSPEVQLLVKHAVRVVGLLCRAHMEEPDAGNVHQIVDELEVLLQGVLDHVNSTRFLDGTRIGVYAEELKTTAVKVTSLVTRQKMRTGPSCAVEEEEEERHEAEDMLSETEYEEEHHPPARRKMKGRARETADSSRFVPHSNRTNIDPTNSGYFPPVSPCPTRHISVPSPSDLLPDGLNFVPHSPPPTSPFHGHNIDITNNPQYFDKMPAFLLVSDVNPAGRRSTLLRYILSWKRHNLPTRDHLDQLQAESQSAPSRRLRFVRDTGREIGLHRSTGVACVLADEAVMAAAILWTSYRHAPDPRIWEEATTKLVEKVAILLDDILASIRIQASSSLLSSLLYRKARRRRMDAHHAELRSTLVEIALYHLDLQQMSSRPTEEQEDIISRLNDRGRPSTADEGEVDVEAAGTKRSRLEGQTAEGTHMARQETERIPARLKGKGREQVDTGSSTATAPEHEGVSLYAEFSGGAGVVNAGGSGQGPSTPCHEYPPYPALYPPYPATYQHLPGPSSYGEPSFSSGLWSSHHPSFSSTSGIYAPPLSPTVTSKQNSGTSLSTGSTNLESERSRRGGRRSRKTKDGAKA